MKIIIVSGGFDPLHIGHMNYLIEAKKLGDELIIIVNNDNWLISKKGYVFMPQGERRQLLEKIFPYACIVISTHEQGNKDMSINKDLKDVYDAIHDAGEEEKQLHHIFLVNGGDRAADNIPELELCKELGIETVFGVGGGKIQSSSELVKNAREYA